MIVSIERAGSQKPEKYSYPSAKINILLGRNPKPDEGVESIIVDEPTASRSHLLMKLRNKSVSIMDLQSSNGTTVNGDKVEPNQWVKVQCGDKIGLGDGQAAIVVSKRADYKQTENDKGSNALNSGEGDSSSSQSRSRSRDKKKNGNNINQLLKQLKVSESSLKMLQQMTAQKKSKIEKIKFLKLMGCKNVDAHWQEIETYLEGKSKFVDKNNSKKAAEELQKQFDSGRGTFQKKGLGRK